MTIEHQGNSREEKTNHIEMCKTGEGDEKAVDRPVGNEEGRRETKLQKEATQNNHGMMQSIKTMLAPLLEWVNNRGKNCALQSDVREIRTSVRDTGDAVEGCLRKKMEDVGHRIEAKIEDYPKKDYFNGFRDELRSIKENVKDVKSRVEDDNGSVIKAVRNLARSHGNNKEEWKGRMDDLEEKIRVMAETTETMQSLPRKVDGIAETLTTKGLSLRQEIPSINHDEETIAELAECGEKILQQLTIAARWYARKLPELKAHDEALKNLSTANEKAKEEARKAGYEAGKRAVIKDLLSKYDEKNLYALLNPSDPAVALEQLKILANFLGNQGVEPIYDIHQEMVLREEDRMKYEPNIARFAPGKIVITSPGYTFDSQTIAKATYQWYDEFHAAQQAEAAPLSAEELTKANESGLDVKVENNEASENPVVADTVAMNEQDNPVKPAEEG